MRIINFDDGFTSSTAPTVEQLAESVSVAPAGNLSSTDVQAALEELQGGIDTANTDITALETDKLDASEVGATDGVCELDGDYIPMARIPAALLGSVQYQGTWDASTNTPALASGVGTKGYYYVVSADGATTLDTVSDWKQKDYAIYNGTAWEKIDNTDAVTSVNGQVGIVVLAATDVGLGNVDNTSNTTERAASATLANKTLDKPVIDDYADFNEE